MTCSAVFSAIESLCSLWLLILTVSLWPDSRLVEFLLGWRREGIRTVKGHLEFCPLCTSQNTSTLFPVRDGVDNTNDCAGIWHYGGQPVSVLCRLRVLFSPGTRPRRTFTAVNWMLLCTVSGRHWDSRASPASSQDSL